LLSENLLAVNWYERTIAFLVRQEDQWTTIGATSIIINLFDNVYKAISVELNIGLGHQPGELQDLLLTATNEHRINEKRFLQTSSTNLGLTAKHQKSFFNH